MEIESDCGIPMCDTCLHHHHAGVKCQICGHVGKSKIPSKMKAKAAQSRSYKVEFYDGPILQELVGTCELLFELRRIICNELGVPENQEFDSHQELHSRHVIAWVGDLPIGFGRFQILNNSEGQQYIIIDRLGVMPTFRMKGFANYILEQIMLNIQQSIPGIKVITIRVPTVGTWIIEKITSKGWHLANDAPLETRGNLTYALYAIHYA